MTDTLATLARLRQLQVTGAKQGFADALRCEAEAEAALEQARQAPRTEASRVAAHDEPLLAGAFANWLPRSAVLVRAHMAQLAAAMQERGVALARLQAAEGALEAVGTLQEEQAAVAHKADLRRAQMRLDDIGAAGKARRAVLS